MNSKKMLAKITENWPAKVLSVAAALILSVFHRMNTLETRFFSVQLHTEASEILVPASSYSRVIRVSLRGDANSIYPILEDDIETFIDLKKYSADGSYRIPVQVRKKGSAIGVEPLEISVDPLEIPLRLERKLSRNIPVIPVFQGTVADGFELVSQSLVPAGVYADGPHSALESKSEFRTEVISLDGRYEDFSVMVNIDNDDPFIVIRGSGMAEYRGIIRRIARQSVRTTADEYTRTTVGEHMRVDTGEYGDEN